MSWNDNLAKEYFKKESTQLTLSSGRVIKSALNRDSSWEDAHLIVKEHLELGMKVKIKGFFWEVIRHEGLGFHYKPKEKGFRVYILKPIKKFSLGDTIRIKRKVDKYQILSIKDSWYKVKSSNNRILFLSLFFQDHLIKT